MQNEAQRVIDWNSKRYKQKFDCLLQHYMIKEEVDELLDANNTAESADVFLDLMFYCMGGLWKLGLDAETIQQSFNIVCDANDTKVAKKTATHVKANIDKGANFIPPEKILLKLFESKGIK